LIEKRIGGKVWGLGDGKIIKKAKVKRQKWVTVPSFIRMMKLRALN
jgi:hypothetical protein